MAAVKTTPAQILFVAIAVLLGGGCGGVQTASTGDLRPAAAPVATPPIARGAIAIAPVRNLTDDEAVDDLGHYLHLKAAEWLEEAGYEVISDDLLADADLPFLADLLPATTADTPTLEIAVSAFAERAGATVSLGLFSKQSQHAEARVRVQWRGTAGPVIEREGRNRKGAWGAIAKVNREALTQGEGFWAFDQSLAGGAAGEALRNALAALVADDSAGQ